MLNMPFFLLAMTIEVISKAVPAVALAAVTDGADGKKTTVLIGKEYMLYYVMPSTLNNRNKTTPGS